ncbi:MAG: GNAT family N-acetyltransferase, partial [Actinomycetia bacterium]|nr:GNAT family N-acetyltransferase [Actinomycetes bacterium]
GQGLGAPMTSAGLDWLHQQGLATGMLSVEADNPPAVQTYQRLGFSIVRTDRAWLLS